MEWYIAVDGKAKNVPEGVLIYKIKNKEITPETLVVNEQIKNWVQIKETAIWQEYALDSADVYNNTSVTTAKKQKLKIIAKNHQQTTSRRNGVSVWQ